MQTVLARLVDLANRMDQAGFTAEASFIDKTLNMFSKPKENANLNQLAKKDIFNDPTMLDDDIADQDPNYKPGQKTVWDELRAENPSEEELATV